MDNGFDFYEEVVGQIQNTKISADANILEISNMQTTQTDDFNLSHCFLNNLLT